MDVPFLGPSYESQSPDADCERTVNWYPELLESSGGKTKIALYPSPGYTLFATIPEVNVRSIGTALGRCFALAGTGLYEIDSVGTVTSRGTVATDTQPTAFVCNNRVGGELFFASGGNGYVLDLTTHVLTEVLTGTAHYVGFIDGYFVALNTTTSTLQVSDLNDGLTWNVLMVAQRTTASDPWVSMVVSDRQIHLFGTETTESWYNSGNPDFPFDPIQGSLIRDGVAAPYSTVALVDNTRIWLTANAEGIGVVKRASGYQPARISTHAVEHAIQQYAVTSDAVAMAYQIEGHSFYLLSFPTARATWVFDTTTTMWHEQGWWDSVNMRFDAIRGRCHCVVFGTHLMGDRVTGGVYSLSTATYDDIASTGMRRLRQGPHLSSQSRWIYYDEVRLLMETGVGTIATPSPQVMLQWSDDGGHTWSNEHWRTAGSLVMGNFGLNVIWRRCGRSQDRVFRVVTSDPVPWRLLGMQVGT